MTNNPPFRRATEADLPRIFEIRGAVKENRLSDPSVVTREHCLWYIAGPGNWVWQDDSEIAGFSASDPRDGSIWALFVDPKSEGRGIGRALLTQAVQVLREAGFSAATLTTDPGTRAARFYREAGWIEDGFTVKGELRFRLPL
jgi:ribosomal protein S18 acetylase RimI-like enzyme